MNILELLEGVVREPVSTLNIISRKKPVGWALAVFGVSTLLGTISTDPAVFEQLPALPVSNPVAQIAASLAGFFIFSGLLYLLSRLFKGSGDYLGFLSALGFAQFPAFLSPIAALVKSGGGLAGTVLGWIISMGSSVWMLVLQLIALRESRGLTTGASILTYLILVMLVALPIIGVVALFIFSMGPYL